MKFPRLALLCVLCLIHGSATSGAKCRTTHGKIIHSDTYCPVGSVVEEYTPETFPALWTGPNVPKLSINIKNSDIRTTLFILGEELFPGRLYLDDTVAGTIDLREFSIPVDTLFYKVLQMKRMEVLKIRNNYYVFPSAMGRSVAASMAGLKGL